MFNNIKRFILGGIIGLIILTYLLSDHLTGIGDYIVMIIGFILGGIIGVGII